MEKIRVAVATNNKKGLDDTVSDVFGRAKTFTLLDIENGQITTIQVLENSTADFHHGAGPIAVKMLVDNGVNIVVANQVGFGASELLKQHNIKMAPIEPGTKVADATLQAIET
ncbi:MAG: NifB/NifX family molybdenum-iron cluster-binding protein [Candidatus Bathyarchaeota archaeon]|nr:NifB/NifX family molybdenum-iron cluster-binding protein [Candidatus Bathyarchaeum tardum]WGM88629.1 MAG: NifB/NifX family molybdenum-iron cluster-binding protein [Candidatus Bathyarchaeum tardum]WNZ29115.1 MAG: NifB/NifX family molybdenum-iron cluster-binding protein [Candidatus Bathyarchaeota archaeon]